MNSEDKLHIDGIDASAKQQAKEKQEQLDSIAQGQAMAAQSFMKHPHWVIFVDDLTKQKAQLVNSLINDVLTKERMNRLRYDIQMIDKIVTQPVVYLKRLQSFYSRKNLKGA